MRSFKLLVYKSEEDVNKLEEIAIDINLNPVFLSAIEMVDDETYLGADGRHVFLCQKNRYLQHYQTAHLVIYRSESPRKEIVQLFPGGK
jgi:hypothetical protein